MKHIVFPRSNWAASCLGNIAGGQSAGPLNPEGSGGGDSLQTQEPLGTFWICPFMPHTLEREAETTTNTLRAPDGKEDFIFVTQPQGHVKSEAEGIARKQKKSCFTLMVSVKRPGVRTFRQCPCPILSSTVGDPVMPSRFLPTCSKTLGLPPSLSPTILLSH